MTDNLRDRIRVIQFRIARRLFMALDRWLDRYLDGLSEEKLEGLYQQAVRSKRD